MIKIEFKDAQFTSIGLSKLTFVDKVWIEHIAKHLKDCFNQIKGVTNYIPTQDPMLDRSHILTQLGITEQEDKLFQEQYKNV
ncbi:MAG: hypothetical protein V4608_14720 [Bacteroidota bacterium]